MAKVLKLRIVKGKFTPEQFRALDDIINTILSRLEGKIDLITVAKHPQRVIYIIRFYLTSDASDDEVHEVLKEVDLKIVDIVHDYFEGKRNVIALSYAEEEPGNRTNRLEEQEVVVE